MVAVAGFFLAWTSAGDASSLVVIRGEGAI